MTTARSQRRWRAIVALVGVAALAGACSTSSISGGASGSSTSGAVSATTSSRPPTLTASAKGVTATTIKIGFSYIDLETLAKSGIIKISHGPYEQIITALVNDVNAHGGINDRKLQLFTALYSPIGNTDQLAACTKLTEDDGVFAVLNGLLQDNNLCIVQQHSTILIGGNLNGPLLAKARAPWATAAPSDERSITALVQLMDQNGYLKGHTVAIYAQATVNKPLVDLAGKALQDRGYEAVDTALFDVPTGDTAAASAQDKVIAARFQDKHVDTVINVGLFTPGADWDSDGFHPALFALSSGNIAAAVFTNPLGKFPLVAGLGASADPDAGYNTAEMQRCRAVWKSATGKDIQTTTQEDLAGRSSGNVAMSIACTALQIFVAAARAAGPELTNQSFAKGLASIGTIALADAPVASFGRDKPDGEDSFQLLRLDPSWKQGQGKQQFTAIGAPLTLNR
jgi:hypothetical protein